MLSFWLMAAAACNGACMVGARKFCCFGVLNACACVVWATHPNSQSNPTLRSGALIGKHTVATAAVSRLRSFLPTEHCRAGQGRAGQGRAGQGRAGQGEAGRGRAWQLSALGQRFLFTDL
jgi:hypothetical protein